MADTYAEGLCGDRDTAGTHIKCLCGEWDIVGYIEDYFLWEGHIGHWKNPTFPDAISPVEAHRILQDPEERETFLKEYRRLDFKGSSYPVLEFVSEKVAMEYAAPGGLAKAAQRFEREGRMRVRESQVRRPLPARFVMRWGTLYLLAIGWPAP